MVKRSAYTVDRLPSQPVHEQAELRWRRRHLTREPASLHGLLAPQTADGNEHLHVRPNEIRKIGAGDDVVQLRIAGAAERHELSSHRQHLILERHAVDQYLEQSIAPASREAWKHRAEPDGAKQLSELRGINRHTAVRAVAGQGEGRRVATVDRQGELPEAAK